MYSLIRKLFYLLPLCIQIRIKKDISLLYYDAGIGDSFLVGAVAREIKNKYGNKIKITVNCVKSEVLENNPYIDSISNKYNGIDLNYHYGKISLKHKFDKNILDIMCKKVGISISSHTVEFFPTEAEVKSVSVLIKEYKKPIITIQTTPGEFDNGRKIWPNSNWIELVKSLLNKEYTIVQLGNHNEIFISGSKNLLGKLSIRDSIALIQQADLHIGVVSSLMHGAEAVGTKAVILFGGFERYLAHQYSNIVPIESNITCSPCGLVNSVISPCPNNNECLRQITPGIVLDKVYSVLKNRKY